MSNVKRPRKPSFKDQAIDVEDLANMSNMGGMLSFLDTKPEDYARLFAKAAEVDQAGAETTRVTTTQPTTTRVLPTQERTTQPPTTQVDSQDSKEIEAPTQVPTTQSTTTQETPTQVKTTQVNESEEESPRRPILVKSPGSFRKISEILPQIKLIEEPVESPTPVTTTQVPTTQVPIGLSPSVSLGQGRVHKLKIREAKIVQDGHTGSEQMVYDFLWRTAAPLNANLRSIRIGRWGIANAVHISDTTAKAALKGLIEKLAIEKVDTVDNVLGFEYYVHSWGSCLTRRKEKGLTHVIKSKGVVFVDPETGVPMTGYFFPRPTQVPTTQVTFEDNSNSTRVVVAQGRGVEPDRTTQVVPNPSLYNHLENQNTITTTLVRRELEAFTTTDEAGIKDLIRKVQANAPDATWPELEHFIQEKGRLLKKVRIERSAFGFLLTAIPKCFESPSFQTWRQGREASEQESRRMEDRHNQFMELQGLRAILSNPEASPEEKQAAQEILDVLES